MNASEFFTGFPELVKERRSECLFKLLRNLREFENLTFRILNENSHHRSAWYQPTNLSKNPIIPIELFLVDMF